MSMNGNLNGHGKILMLALMMVTSTFAVIGTTAAGPSGYEQVTWDATNGYMSTSNGYVYVYSSVADVDMTFTSSDLEVGEMYELEISVYEHPFGTEISYNTYTWNATDADADGYADNSTELLSSEGMEDYHCYDADATLWHVDAAGDLLWVAAISQLIGINVEECEMDTPTIDIFGEYEFNVGDSMPFEIYVDDLDETKNYTLAWGLYELGDYDECPFDQDHPDSPCNVEACDPSDDSEENWDECDAAIEDYCANNEDPACDPDYNPDQWLAGSEDPDHVLVDQTTNSWLYLNLTQYIDSDGCYYLEADITDADGVDDFWVGTQHWFEVGAGCEELEPDYPHVWVSLDKSFDPMNDQMDWYAADEEINIHYGAMDLLPDTFYASVIQIMGPHDDGTEETHEEEAGDDELGEGEEETHEEHDDLPAWEAYDNFTSDSDGEGTEGMFAVSAGTLESGIYSVMYTVVEIDTETGDMLAVFFDYDTICVGEDPCGMFSHQWDLDPESHTTGEAHYRMYFDQFDNQEGNHNGILEIFSAQELDPSYRGFADFNENGMVDIEEAMEFINMLMSMNNGDECPFDMEHPNSPCNAEVCEDHESQACGDYVYDYCENMNPGDPACEDMNMGDECPFDKDHPDSPCNVEVCDPSSENNNDSACNEHVMDYCENINPDDPFCGEMGECPFDQDHPDSPCNVEACDPSSENHNESACNEHVMDYCENINPDDPACGGGEEADNGTTGHHCGDCGMEEGDHECQGDTCDHPSHDEEHECQGDTCDHPSHDDVDVTLDGASLGHEDWEWVWIENLMGPVDGSDGLPVMLLHGMGWDLSLDDWETTDQHTVMIFDDGGPLLEPCTGNNDATSGSFSVYDSWSWSPLEPDMGTWAVHADGDGWISPFDCDSGALMSLSVTFVKTINDYNADNLEDIDEGPQNDWEQDVTDNLPPECHIFASLENSNNYSEAEEHFSAPTGDHTVELESGNYWLWAHCFDPDGDMVWASISVGGVSMEFLEESQGEAFIEFTLIAGMPDIAVEYHWDSTGGHSGSGTITISVLEPVTDNTNNNTDDTVDPITNDDGTVACPPGSGLVLNADATECVAPSPDNVGDIIDDVTLEDEGGAIPGFTTALSVISMLGAVLVMSRRKQDC